MNKDISLILHHNTSGIATQLAEFNRKSTK
nr:MAG TPA: hypothetical protein [Caudoviricetes sp.]